MRNDVITTKTLPDDLEMETEVRILGDETYDDEKEGLTIEEILQSNNVAELLSDRELSKIAGDVIDGFETDEGSADEWRELSQKAMEIAKQTLEVRNEPLAVSSNVKYPAITQAGIEFASRTYPEFVKGDRVAKFKVVGTPTNSLALDRANRVERFLNYKLMSRTDWEEQTDKLLHTLPIIGVVFKKVYYDPIADSFTTELCSPYDVVVNHSVDSLKKASRITHVLELTHNDIREKITTGLFIDVDIDTLSTNSYNMSYGDDDEIDTEKDTFTVLEQHCYIDLDNDGYKEPYIVTVHRDSRTVFRIVANFKEDDVIKTPENEVIRINNETYFVDYHFIPNPDGGFYSLGIGQLLYPINEAINTVINQLIDAGTLGNLQGGFIGRALRIKSGEFRIKMGEWKSLDTPPASKISDHIYPLPVKEPSPTLFQLLGTLISTVKELAQVSEITQGNQLAQNAPATSVMALLEQGLTVYNAIQKRIFRSFKKELEQIYKICYYYLDDVEYQQVLNDQMALVLVDFNLSDMDIVPVATPGNSSTAQRMARAQAISQLPSVPQYLKDVEILKALDFSDQEIQQLVPPPNPNPPPSPQDQLIMAETKKLDAEASKIQAEPQIKMADINRKIQQDLQLQQESQARMVKMEIDGAVKILQTQIEQQKAQAEAQMSEVRVVTEQIRQMNDLLRNQRDVVESSAQTKEVVDD